jgi:hypothetical protein
MQLTPFALTIIVTVLFWAYVTALAWNFVRWCLDTLTDPQ